MKAMILAAGRGERMRPLTDRCPKPLLPLRGKPLMQWALEALLRAGVRELVVNTAWLGQQIEDHFAAQRLSDVRQQLSISEHIGLHFSSEGRDFGGALETAGGIVRALPLLAPGARDVFWVAAGDVFAPDFDFAADAVRRFVASDRLAHLWLVPNPPFHPAGDFALGAAGRLSRQGARDWTYANLALVRPALVDGVARGQRAALGPCLFRAADAGRLGGSTWAGEWHNVGTPEQLQALQDAAAAG